MDTEKNDLQKLADSEKPAAVPNPMAPETPPKPKKTLSTMTIVTLVIATVALIVAVVAIVFAIIQTTNQSSVKSTCKDKYCEEPITRDKPLIYLYPETETAVNVKLGSPDKLTASYPSYTTEGWQVIAQPNGDLLDTKTNRHLYGLYWEGKNSSIQATNEGFVVPGSETTPFLEEKLAVLGLNEREANEFIIYWLPKLQNNRYNYIRFAIPQEIEQDMPLAVTPQPDTTIRVLMVTQPLDSPITIQEQKLQTPERYGFTVVEWGGTIVSNGITE